MPVYSTFETYRKGFNKYNVNSELSHASLVIHIPGKLHRSICFSFRFIHPETFKTKIMVVNFFKVLTWLSAFNFIALAVAGAFNVGTEISHTYFLFGLVNLSLFIAGYFLWAYYERRAVE
ncbi:MAG: hypothetical protein EOP48_10005 [Sphingobacteriales bacterium]|nr:MAG: hypothetical protein EOP48_10005 [Sphingobacteriales bacterium]